MKDAMDRNGWGMVDDLEGPVEVDERHVRAASFEMRAALFPDLDPEDVACDELEIVMQEIMRRVFLEDADDLFRPPLGLAGMSEEDREFIRGLRERDREPTPAELERARQIASSTTGRGLAE